MAVADGGRASAPGRGRPGGAWTIERIYDTFPRLAERKSNGGGQLSGGEQQMLAISRALLLNPRLLVMDEPTEGLAPVIVAQVEDMLVRLGEEGDIDVLVIEQNIGVATAISEQVAIMVNGRVNRVMPAGALAADRDLQQRLLGVGRHAVTRRTTTLQAPSAATAPQRRRRPAQDLHVEPEAADPLVAAGAGAAIEACGAHRTVAAPSDKPAGACRAATVVGAGDAVVLVAGTLDTKGDELRFMRDILKADGVRSAPGRPVDIGQAFERRHPGAPDRRLSSARCRGRLHQRSRHIGRRHDGGVRALDRGARAVSPGSSRPAVPAAPRWWRRPCGACRSACPS